MHAPSLGRLRTDPKGADGYLPQVEFACVSNDGRSLASRLLAATPLFRATWRSSSATGVACPDVPGSPTDWPVEDPGGQDPSTVRRVTTDLDRRVHELPAQKGLRQRAGH